MYVSYMKANQAQEKLLDLQTLSYNYAPDTNTRHESGSNGQFPGT